MKILALDIGAGTQDILLFDSTNTIENSIKMVMPSPTVIAATRIREATRAGLPLALTGVNMGGGPVTGATQAHIRSGLTVHATVEAATTFDDDMEMVRAMGVSLAGDDEIESMRNVRRVVLRDLDLEMVRVALRAFEMSPEWDAVAVAVFDHGDSPPGYSDRKFRFDHLRRQMDQGKRDVTSFCYLSNEVPEYMTRMLAVVKSMDADLPLLLMDTAEAAVLGALEDDRVASQRCKVSVNLGNEHTLAVHLHGKIIQGIFEHHTHLLTRDKLESYLMRLVHGDLDGQEVWLDQGHGAVTLGAKEDKTFFSVTGPFRHVLEGSTLDPYFAVPCGDMMLAGSFGLVRAWAEKHEPWREEITRALRSAESGPTAGSH
ncbi:MAG: DUF1786 family protein [SAR202 cluster bacterium]|nr:DUF1786 family protein [SAR202 cluster bacterium]